MSQSGPVPPESAVSAERAALLERQLMLVDRIQVLQNELAEWRVRDQMTHNALGRELERLRGENSHLRAENELLHKNKDEIQRSVTWRLGRLALLPVRVARRVVRGRTA